MILKENLWRNILNLYYTPIIGSKSDEEAQIYLLKRGKY